MQKGESGLRWWTSLRPAKALLATLGAIIMVLVFVVQALYRDQRKMYQEMIEAREACSEQKMTIIYGAIKKQEEMNLSFNEKVEELNKELREYTKELKAIKKK